MPLPLSAQIALVAAGAAAGALARWQLGLWLNPCFDKLAFGTLLANWLGCLLMGVCLGWVWQSGVSEAWRLLLVVGLLGSFTTFSAFSAEVVENMMAGRWAAALLTLALHTLGGLLWTVLGMAAVRYAAR